MEYYNTLFDIEIGNILYCDFYPDKLFEVIEDENEIYLKMTDSSQCISLNEIIKYGLESV